MTQATQKAAAYSIPLGAEDRVADLYSYPNSPGSAESLGQTVEHWFGQTLERDGLAARGATSSVRVEGSDYYLDLEGPPEAAARFPEYGARLPQFLRNGWDALAGVVPRPGPRCSATAQYLS
jgi:hypothetical protein